MKKTILLVIALLIGLAGCSGSSEDWPKEIKGADYAVTRIDTLFSGTYSGAMMQYMDVSESYVVEQSGLIAKLEIIEEPVEYKVDYLFMGTKNSKIVLAFKAKIIKVFYTNADVKEGDKIKFLRKEFSETEKNAKIVRSSSKETIKLEKDRQYILFLEDNTQMQKQDEIETREYGTKNSAKAYKEIADYFCSDPCRTIIICNDDGSYEFDSNFGSLTANSVPSNSPYGFIMMRSSDSEFETNVQKLADSKNNVEE